MALTRDKRIKFRLLELHALEAAGVRAFIVICGNVRGAQTAEILRKAMPRIIKAVTDDSLQLIEAMVALTGIERVKAQFTPVQFSVSH